MSEARETYRKYLNEGICEVTFTKRNGQTRKMRCTTNNDLVPGGLMPSELNEDSGNVLTCWDLDKNDWRSFRIDSVNTFHATA